MHFCTKLCINAAPGSSSDDAMGKTLKAADMKLSKIETQKV